MNKDWIRKLVEQKEAKERQQIEAKEKATKKPKVERESQLMELRTGNSKKWEISAREVILPLLDEYVAEFKKMGYKWASHCDSHTVIVGARKQAISKITLEAPNEKETPHSPQITSPSMEFTPPPVILR
jgi:hypothetical protein